METINDLLRALDNKVPASIAKRLDGLNKLNEKLSVAREENSTNPTEESQEQLDEITEFITDTQDDLREDLSELVAKKREADLKARQIAKNKADLEAKKIAEEKALKAKEKQELEEQKELKQKELEQKELSEKESLEAEIITKTNKESGIGWGSLVLGGALLILSAGAINYFGKKR
jgi:hypothetical protein